MIFEPTYVLKISSVKVKPVRIAVTFPHKLWEQIPYNYLREVTESYFYFLKIYIFLSLKLTFLCQYGCHFVPCSDALFSPPSLGPSGISKHFKNSSLSVARLKIPVTWWVVENRQYFAQ